MSLGQKLIERTLALAQKVKRHAPDYEKINQQPAVLARAVGSKRQILEAQRRDDDGFGLEVVAQKIKIQEVLANSATLDRHDFGVSDFGIRMTLSDSTAESDFQIVVGDLVEILTESSALFGQVLKITAVISPNVFRLENDVAGFVTENNDSIRLMQSSSKPAWNHDPSEQV